MKVLFVVTHLLGTGHLVRTLVIARAFAAAGHEVCVLSGGMRVPHLDTAGLRLEQVPPLRSDGVNFRRLLDGAGREADQSLLDARRQHLLTCLGQMRPDVVVTELFPFGRRVLGGEFMALLEAAHRLSPRPLVAASIRDILAPPSKPSRAEATLGIVADFYDVVLVHADPQVVALEDSWPVTADLSARLRYTGFVAPAPAAPHPLGRGAGEILVTSGGGEVGRRLFEIALATACRLPDRKWRLLVGGGAAQARIAELAGQAPANAIVEPATPEFRSMLRHAAASVSLCGYNTALDVMQAGVPAIFVPFDEGGETEQAVRATSLARLPGIAHLPAGDLTPDMLYEALEAVLAAPRRDPDRFQADGAQRSVDIVTALRGEMCR